MIKSSTTNQGTPVSVAFGKLILSGVVITEHPSWVHTKITAVTDSDGVEITHHHMIGREMPFSKSDLT